MPALSLVVNSSIAVFAAIQGEAVVALGLGFAAGFNFAECVRAVRSQAR